MYRILTHGREGGVGMGGVQIQFKEMHSLLREQASLTWVNYKTSTAVLKRDPREFGFPQDV